METSEKPVEVKTLKIGRDQVTISEKQIIIDAAAEMPDWQVRAHNDAVDSGNGVTDGRDDFGAAAFGEVRDALDEGHDA